jgi:hypothetical protein
MSDKRELILNMIVTTIGEPVHPASHPNPDFTQCPVTLSPLAAGDPSERTFWTPAPSEFYVGMKLEFTPSD